MARYIPTDDTARYLTREHIAMKVRAEFERLNLQVTVGELGDDGSCPVYLAVPQAEFDFRTLLDIPQIDGRAWIDDSGYPRVDWQFGSADLDLVNFLRAHIGTA